MAVELRRWSRVNERDGRAEACYIAPCQIAMATMGQVVRYGVASDGVRLQYRGSVVRRRRRPRLRLLAPPGSGAHSPALLPPRFLADKLR